MRGQAWFLGLLALGIVTAFLATPLFGLKLRHFLSPSAPSEYNGSDLAAENLILKTKLTELEGASIASSALNNRNTSVLAEVYSHYPFNIKNEILIAAGDAEGVKEGESVVIPVGTSSSGIFLGRVISVSQHSSLVQTIFDERWQSAVKVGVLGSEALLRGGFSPKLTLIAKDVKITPGDIILNADPAFPYGLSVAEVDLASISKDQVFQEASIRLPYDISRIGYVAVLKANP